MRRRCAPLVALWAAAAPGWPCDTWVALKDATADGSVILAKNSDRPPIEAQVVVHIPRAKHPPGSTVRCTYVEIPQAAETYEVLLSKIWWSFGGEHGMNEHGVAIGNEAVVSKEPYRWNDGLLGMDLLRLGLERGRTADEALHVITALLERYSQSGDAEHPDEWGRSSYHNSFIIADPNEAWVLETAGRYWAAKRLTSGVYSISNIYSIERDWDEASPDLVEHAVQEGWTRSAAEFNFARDYGDYWRADGRIPGNAQLRRNATYACLQRDRGKVTPLSMIEDQPRAPRVHLRRSPVGRRGDLLPDSVPARQRPAAVPQRGVHFAHLRPRMPPPLRQVYWASLSNPCCNVFQPLYLHGVKPPEAWARGTSTYSADSPWWGANRLKVLCDLNYEAVNPAVRAAFDETERWEADRQGPVEATARRLLESGKGAEAVAALQAFVDENSGRIEQQHPPLQQSAEEALKSRGLRYLFLEYVKGWTVKKGVPLPLP